MDEASPIIGVAAIEAALATMPLSPGVYRMLDAKGDALYVGKARSLKKRVTAYTQIGRLDERLRRMVSETVTMAVITTHAEAAIQHRAEGRQVLSVADADRSPSVSADRQTPWGACAERELLGAVRLSLGGEPD